MPAPKVNVLILTYNHEQFIGQALASVLAQEVDFPYTIVVGEDCSTDGTRAIVEGYRVRYPDRVRPLYQARNVGPGANLKACLATCQAPYIAALEGDDYWTDPHKLARQVAWLDANPDFTLCFHHVETFWENNDQPASYPPPASQTVFTFTDFLLYTNMPATGSVVLRNCRPALPDWLFAVYPIDMPLFVLYGELGKAKLLPEYMGRYRIHPGSTWSSQPAERKRQYTFAMLGQVVRHYAATPHARQVRRVVSKLYLSAADEYVKYRQPARAARLLAASLRLWPAYTPRHIKSLLGVSLRWLRGILTHWPA